MVRERERIWREGESEPGERRTRQEEEGRQRKGMGETVMGEGEEGGQKGKMAGRSRDRAWERAGTIHDRKYNHRHRCQVMDLQIFSDVVC